MSASIKTFASTLLAGSTGGKFRLKRVKNNGESVSLSLPFRPETLEPVALKAAVEKHGILAAFAVAVENVGTVEGSKLMIAPAKAGEMLTAYNSLISEFASAE